MKPFEWDEAKNRWLKQERGVSFEQVVYSIANGNLMDVIRHPNQAKYRGQWVYVVLKSTTTFILFLTLKQRSSSF